MKESEIEKAVLEDRNKYASELFNKPYSQLIPGEQWQLEDYINDIKNPEFRLVKSYHGIEVEVNQTGTCVKNHLTGRVYKIYTMRKGYRYIYLRDPISGGKYTDMIHRLVAKAFVENPENKNEVNHINGNKGCNWYRNLEWVDRVENIEHAVRTGLIKTGEACPWTKYTDQQVEQMCQLLHKHHDWSYKHIAAESGTDVNYVGDIVRGSIRKDIVDKYLPFPKRETSILKGLRGESNPTSKYSNEQIKEVCELLKNYPEMTFKVISEKTGVKPGIINSLYRNEVRKDIVKEYLPFPERQTRSIGENHYNSRYSADQIKRVCELLEEVYEDKSNLTHREIAEIAGVAKHTVDSINSGLDWKSISKDYAFYQGKMKS